MFGRKKEVEVEEEFDEESNFSKRKLKDLNPQNKKKRKEPPKPWGKKERLSILIILLITVIVSAILAIGAANNLKFHLSWPNFDFSSLNIFKEQTIIVNKK
jgi:hypothetical protein